MTIVRNGPAPYTSTTAIPAVIDGFRHRSPATPVTVEVLELLGIAHSIAPRTLQSLKLLGLLDEAGEPTPALIGLREAEPEDLPSRLAEVVRAAYAEIFAYRDPVTDPPERIVEAFRLYEPASMRPRMVRLFYSLCHSAGIISEVPAIENAPRNTLTGAAPKPVRHARRQRRSEDPTPPPKPTVQQPPPEHERRVHRDIGLSHLHPALVGLLATIPPMDEAWPTRERFDNFKTAFDATLRISNPVPPKGTGSPEE
jgi:hypothetical protein